MTTVNVTGLEDEEIRKTVKTLAGMLEAVMPKTSERRAIVKLLVDQGDIDRVIRSIANIACIQMRSEIDEIKDNIQDMKRSN